ncbi:hypothetical protein BJX99DRAFT_258450 [Aspergillus californicus]
MGQPKVTPLPSNINLDGKTAVITGATAGLGLETARQLLTLNISTLVLAVRNVQKGNACVTDLLADKAIQARAAKPTIHVLELDLERYDSVKAFTKTLQDTIPVIDFLILNAGIYTFEFSRTAHNHERTMQVNYWSNVLLVTSLLPYLESSAEKRGSPVQLTWVGSRRYYKSNTLQSDLIPGPGVSVSVSAHMDTEENFGSISRYGDSKLLCAMFMYTLAPRLDRSRVLFNMVCPGMVHTDLTSAAPLVIRALAAFQKFLSARPVDVGASLIVNAAVLAGGGSHGMLLGDKDVVEPCDYNKSDAGQRVQEMLWAETIEEMKSLTALPPVFV